MGATEKVKILLDNGIQQQFLAEYLGVSKATMSRVKNKGLNLTEQQSEELDIFIRDLLVVLGDLQ